MNANVPGMRPEWPPAPLPLPCLVNSVAISDDGRHVVAGTFYYPYYNTREKETHGAFGIFGVEWGTGKRLWADQYFGWQGVYAVAISGDGTVAAAGGLYTDRADGADQPEKYQGLLRAYDTATGNKLLDFTGITGAGADKGRSQRVSCVALSDDGKVLAAVADKVYVFVRAGASFPAQPTAEITYPDAFNGDAKTLPTAVAVHPSGNWLAACDKRGHVLVAQITGGQVQPAVRWDAGEVPINRSDPKSAKGPVILLSIAVSKHADSLVWGGNDYVYCSSLQEMLQPQPNVARFDTWDGTPPPLPANGVPLEAPPQNVRWVAISGDGGLIAAVVNRYREGGRNGSLVVLRNAGNRLTPAWEQRLPRNPNSVSVDAAGRYVAASDGYPFGTPGGFYCFDAHGMLRWRQDTTNMNWPIAISANAQAIAAGGDDGMLYSFNP